MSGTLVCRRSSSLLDRRSRFLRSLLLRLNTKGLPIQVAGVWRRATPRPSDICVQPSRFLGAVSRGSCFAKSLLPPTRLRSVLMIWFCSESGPGVRTCVPLCKTVHDCQRQAANARLLFERGIGQARRTDQRGS
jgi:hypothetical protein